LDFLVAAGFFFRTNLQAVKDGYGIRKEGVNLFREAKRLRDIRRVAAA